MPSSSSSALTQQQQQQQQQQRHRFKLQKLNAFFLLIFSLLSCLFNFFLLSLSSAMDDNFYLDDFLPVDLDDDYDASHALRRRRRRLSSPPLSLHHDRLFLVSYQWWNDASKECWCGKGENNGVLYSVSSHDSDEDKREYDSYEDDILSDDDKRECDSGEDDILSDEDKIKRECNSGEDDGLSDEDKIKRECDFGEDDVLSDEDDRECDSGEDDIFSYEDDILLNLKREVDNDNIDKGEGFSGREYALISETMWFKALKWHSDSWTRFKDVDCSLAAEGNNHDVFPIQIRLSAMQQTNSLAVKISLMDNPVQLYKRAYQIFDVQSDLVRIWDFSGQMAQFFVRDGVTFPNGFHGQATEEVVLELQVYGFLTFGGDTVERTSEIARQGSSSRGGSCSSSSTQMNRTDESQSSSAFHSLQSCARGYGETGMLGLTGLLNLGNTCFMNSAVQCLVHTPKLVDYFLGDYKKEINYENPLGKQGELALAFGDLLRKLWAPSEIAVDPEFFKSTLEDFAPQFCGYNQHDSQEFLAFLLDGLHEDLNRVKLKSYIQVGDSEGFPDENMAYEYWRSHLARNDSIIVDTFHGQFRSTLVCPFCKRVSVTFDPFMYLSLPLPSTTVRSLTVTLLSTDGSMPPSPLTVTVPKSGRCKDLTQALSTAASLRDDETLFVAEVFDHRILRSLEDPSDSLALIRDHDCLVAYRLPKETESSRLVVFMHQKAERKFGFRMARQCWSLFGIPLVARIHNILDGSQIYDAYMKLLRPFLNMEEDYNDAENLDDELAKMESRSLSNSDNLWSSDDDLGADLHVASEFQFHFTDERGRLKDQRIKLGKSLDLTDAAKKWNVLVSWSHQMVRRYDTSGFSVLPEVFKPGLLSMRPQESVSLGKCLEGFLKEEPLGPKDMWYCPSCKQHRPASKKLDLWRLPEILVVHLKRFSYSRILKNKLETYVDFPIDNLDLTGFLAHESGPGLNCYRLYAICNHYGGMGGGHYTALVYHVKRWYEFNDRLVEQVREENIRTAAAYVLFYRRISDT
ncbi:hypothetical protein BVRB_5g108750 [Beta vulgaris subsp. vulgaris]|uniref:ubiquitin carboxyl-terminal hydrolase 8 n=1 Tax=Beta vulgaris subsp. vulgaris TaxID=3555 RepID=UPI00065C304B|nr:ubiquitin carboxyl-terminal hydrolase 8 [Beta vulgaris subsp. vulgaris]KMT11558.1 hypothetical protein BVRB_5g108750 [Beta vulgaris subsp. vulgaris]